ncbi:hypothetical protein D1007_08084 [Hordeum vulgare]|nr:hypothetical protein D1007_08084 [Hordeum vulgare]
MELLLLPSRATCVPPAPSHRSSPPRQRGHLPADGQPRQRRSHHRCHGDDVSSEDRPRMGRRRRQGQTPFGLGLDLSEEMRRGMMWRMLAFPAAAVAAEAVLLWCSNSGVDAPAWAGKAG